jgi:hypothetical protein
VRAAQKRAEEHRRQVDAERRADFVQRVKDGNDGSRIFFFDPILPGELASDPQCVANLTRASFFMVDVSDPRFEKVRELVNVRHLHFYDCAGMEVLLKRLAGMPSVETIFFESNKLKPEELDVLATFPNLKSYRMWYEAPPEYRKALERTLPGVELLYE